MTARRPTPRWLTLLFATAFVLTSVGLVLQILGESTGWNIAVAVLQVASIGFMWWLARTNRWLRRP